MNMNKLQVRLLSIFFITLFSSLFAKESVLFVYTSYEPANFRTQDNKDSGFFVEILKEALENRLGLEMKTAIYPWSRCQIMARDGTADILATIPTEERLSYCSVNNNPVWVKQYRIYTWTGHPEISRMNAVRSVSDLKSTKLAVVSYIGNDWSKSVLEVAGIPIVHAVSVESMYLMLMAKRADMIVEDPILVHNMCVKQNCVGRIHSTSGIVEQSPFHYLVSKKSAFHSRMPEFNIVIDEMLKDGTIEKILASYR